MCLIQWDLFSSDLEGTQNAKREREYLLKVLKYNVFLRKDA
jgi:hypothetical protein